MTHERGNPLAFRSPLMLDDFELDSERSRDWSAALVQYAVAQRPANAELLKQWVTYWEPTVVLKYGSVGRTLRASTPRPLQPEAVAAAKAAHSLRSQYG
jgi:toluene monooxygenase system protein E